MWLFLFLFIFSLLLFWWITIWLLSWALEPVLKKERLEKSSSVDSDCDNKDCEIEELNKSNSEQEISKKDNDDEPSLSDYLSMLGLFDSLRRFYRRRFPKDG